MEMIDTIFVALQQFIDNFWFYFPLGVIGTYRWSVWIFKRICAQRYKPLHATIPNYYSSFGIVTPVYSEDPVLFKRALESWERSHPDELIAVIDQSDVPCIKVFNEFALDRPWAKLIVTSTLGKRPALAEGIRVAKSQIVAMVDSDVIWSSNVKQKILEPFKDPRVGGITVKQNAIESQHTWQKIIDMIWDQRNYLDWPSQAAMGKAMSCLSGRTAVYRRRILLPLLEEFLHETIFGRRKESGEDKCLTRLIQREGWKTFYQSNVQIYTYAAPEFKTLWNQKIRWTRNTYNSDLASMLEGWIWKKPYLAFFTIDKFISAFTILIGPVVFCTALYLKHWDIAFLVICIWIIGRGIRVIPHIKRKPKNLLILPVYVGATFWIAIAKIYALVTIRDQKWIRPPPPKVLLMRQVKNSIFTSQIVGLFVLLVIIYISWS